MKSDEFFVRHEFGNDRVTVDQALANQRFPFYAVLDRIRSAHNVGSIFRSADGANVAGLMLCGYTPAPPHRHLAKTALGAVDVVPWQQCPSVDEAIAGMRERKTQILALECTGQSVPLYEFELRYPVALVLGNEVDGLSAETMQQCDATVHLPMHGHKNSLNVSVAFGVAIYEILRRYTQSGLT